MSDSMQRLKHLMSAEKSISNFINYLENVVGMELADENKKWLYEKGENIFDKYYIDKKLKISITAEDDKEALDDYFEIVQDTLGRMYAHIMLLELKLYLKDLEEK